MKKLFAVLAAVLLLAIMACSSKSDDSSSSGNSNSNSNTTSAIVNSTGGTVQLADGANATIPAGAVADNTKVTLTKLAQPQLSASKATALTDTYQISFPAGSVMDQSGSDNFITFKIPVPTSISTTIKKALSHIRASVTNSNADDAYNATEAASNGTSLYGNYMASGSILTIEVPTNIISSITDGTSITVTGVNVINYFPSGTSFYNVTLPSGQGSSPTFTSVSDDQTTKLAASGKTPIILIHGLQIFHDASDPQTAWNYFVNYFYSDSDLTNKYELYSFRYDSSQSIDFNGAAFESVITTCFPSQKVLIVAHSMGGLVAHSYIQQHNGGFKVIKLITLATPYHGSPLVQYARKEPKAIVALEHVLTTLSTVGATDLEWDNYDHNQNIKDPDTKHLSDLNNLLKTQYANLYSAFYGSNLNLDYFPHGLEYTKLYSILKTEFKSGTSFSYESDGVVPDISAFNDGHPSGFVQIGPEIDYDHSQMTGKNFTDPLFDKIKAILPIYNISGTVTLNGTGLAGVTVTLTGASSPSTATTDSSGNYSFSNVANGSYTLSFSDSGYAFNPSSVSVDVNGTNFTVATSIIATATSSTNDYTSPNIGTLKYVPAGSFQRDATSSNISTVSAFHMSQYEITRAQFLAIMGTDPSTTAYSSGINDPVQNVNWYDAIAFCNKLSIAEGLTPVYSVSGVDFSTLTYGDIPITDNNTDWYTIWDTATANWSANGYRLPMEMEWMWAAMGATSGYGYTGGTYTTGYSKAFSGSTGSNDIGDYAWYGSNSGLTTHPVGTKLPNELGLYDMSGNVGEWCWDWYGSYPTGTQTDYRGASASGSRVYRGGNYGVDAPNESVANRYADYPWHRRWGDIGFRVVRNSASGTGGLVPGGWREVSP